jgi:hypothetical protein
MPSPRVPPPEIFLDLLGDALGIAIVSFVGFFT